MIFVELYKNNETDWYKHRDFSIGSSEEKYKLNFARGSGTGNAGKLMYIYIYTLFCKIKK